MPRIDPVPRGALGDLKTVLDAVESRMGFVPNSQLILAHRPEIVRAFAQLGAAINGPSSTCAVTRRRFSSGCKSRPATAPAGSSRSRHGGDEMSEAFG